MSRRTLPVALVAFVMLVLASVSCGGGRVVIGAGTTLVDSGLMTELEASFGSDISVVAGSTAELLELAGRGSLSAVIVHDVAQEQAFLAAHPEANSAPAFTSRFLLVGPQAQVEMLPTESAAAAFAAVAANGWTFVTRADGSGTHSKELQLWGAAGVRPRGPHYVATGQGMGLTLQVADQMDAFTLVEEGVFRGASGIVDLVAAAIDSPELANPYSLIVVAEAGRPFFTWLTGPAGRAAITAANSLLFATDVYVPSGDS